MKKKVIKAGILLALLALISVSIFGNQGFIDVYRSYMEVRNRTAEINSARITIDSLTNERERLMTDTLYIEQIARERLGMAKKGEKIIKFVEENK